MARRSLCFLTNPCFVSTRGPTGWRDEGDPTHRIRIPKTRRIPGSSLFDREILIAKKDGIALPAKKGAKDLFLYDSGFKKKIQIEIAKQRYNMPNPKSLLAVKSWSDLAKTILRYKKIGHLVLSFHSYGGGLMVGGNIRNLDEGSVEKLFFRENNETNTLVEIISFDGCNVAQKPSRLYNFAKWFRAKSVSGYTWFIVVQEFWIDIPKGSDEASIRKDLEQYRKYVISALPDSKALSKRCKTTKIRVPFIISYGSEDGRTVTFPLKLRDQRNAKSLDEAVKRNIRAAEVKQLQKEYDDAVIQAFERVTITLAG